MTTGYAALIAARDGRPFIVVTIAGLGSSAGQHKFCSARPVYDAAATAAASTYREVLADWPGVLNERVHPLGGIAESGELSIELVDIDNEVSDLIRMNSAPIAKLAAGVTAAATSITISNLWLGATLAAGDYLYLGAEAVKIASGSNPYTVTRAQLGTLAAAHKSNDRIYVRSPFLLGRPMRLFLGFNDPTTDDTSETEIGSTRWHVDGLALGQGLNTWSIRGRSQMKMLDRLIYRSGYGTTLEQSAADSVLLLNPAEPETGRPGAIVDHWGDGYVFCEIDGEVVQVLEGGDWVFIQRRGLAGTRPRGGFSAGDSLNQVFLADTGTGYGSFRFQAPGAETSSTGSGTWIQTDHPALILLCLLASPADAAASGFNPSPDNYTAGGGNFSALPPGVGVGADMTAGADNCVDVASFLEVYYWSQDFALPHLTVRAPEPLRAFADREILRLCGWSLRSRADKITLEQTKIPLARHADALGSLVGFDDTNILTEDRGDGRAAPMIAVELDTEIAASTVVFVTKTPDGREVRTSFTDSNFPEIFGEVSGYYQREDRTLTIQAPGIRSASGELSEVLRQRALQLLMRFRRPVWRIEVSTDLSLEATAPGALVTLTHDQLPNLATGERGAASVVCQVIDKRVEVSPGFVGIRWTLLDLNLAGAVGRVTPSAAIASTASNVATVAANRYSDPAATFGECQNTDAGNFTVGDRVRLVSRAGVPVTTSPAYQTITLINTGAGTIKLDGDFGGASEFAGGYVLEYVNRDDATTYDILVSESAQSNLFVFCSDESTRTVGSTTQDAWVYGDY